MRLLSILTVFTTTVLLGCAYPRTIEVYDKECQITARQMVLDYTDRNSATKCTSADCVAQLVGQAGTLAASTVISGSIVVAGNIVYWLEKKISCQRAPAP